MKGIRRSANHARRYARPLATLAALFAILLQTFAIQTHVHAFALQTHLHASVAADAAADLDDGDAHVSLAGEHQVLCVICQALAASGRVALPDATVIAALASATSVAAAREIRLAPRAISYSWRSRAPPVFL